MVAYSFNKIFVPQIERGIKLQTIRADRRRHARPGEPIQLYTAMRTRQCRKLVEPDPVCIGVAPVEILVREAPLFPISEILVNGCPIEGEAAEEFARSDGFAPEWHPRKDGRPDNRLITAIMLMGMFWKITHGPGRFHGVLVTWAQADAEALD